MKKMWKFKNKNTLKKKSKKSIDFTTNLKKINKMNSKYYTLTSFLKIFKIKMIIKYLGNKMLWAKKILKKKIKTKIIKIMIKTRKVFHTKMMKMKMKMKKNSQSLKPAHTTESWKLQKPRMKVLTIWAKNFMMKEMVMMMKIVKILFMVNSRG